jgi:hypothetical protein
MWYFIVKQGDLKNEPYQRLQKMAELTEVEVFNEPYSNFCIFEVTKERYPAFMNFLDLEGIAYELSPQKPGRDDLLDRMK